MQAAYYAATQFGIEKNDDAVDALVYLIFGLVRDGIEVQKSHHCV